MTLFSCQDTRSRKGQNREQYPPQKLFEGKQLAAAEEIFEEDEKGLSEIIDQNPEIINELSSINGYTLLMYASILENLNAMKVLLEKGADPNIIIPRRYTTPLSHAVGTNNFEMAKLLFNYKADPNPSVGNSPLYAALMLGEKQTEKKMIDFLLNNGADINNTSYLGNNLMEAAARNDLETAQYFLEKGGNPIIPGTSLSPMAEYIGWKENERKKHQNPNPDYGKKLESLKAILQEKYNITFPVQKNLKAESSLRIKLYENLNEKDKRSLNFNGNYGENRYYEDKKTVSE